MESITLYILGGALVGVALLALYSAAVHSAKMEKRSTGQMLPHEEEAYLLCKEVADATVKRK